jgi:hypothetical protein
MNVITQDQLFHASHAIQQSMTQVQQLQEKGTRCNSWLLLLFVNFSFSLVNMDGSLCASQLTYAATD